MFQRLWKIISSLWKPTPVVNIYDKCVPLYGLKNPSVLNAITTICPNCRQVLAVPNESVLGFKEPIVRCPKCGCQQKLMAKQKENAE